MTELMIRDLDEPLLQQLRRLASSHGRTAEAEAKAILEQALRPDGRDAWAPVDAIYRRLAASGRSFSDSAELLREDRER